MSGYFVAAVVFGFLASWPTTAPNIWTWVNNACLILGACVFTYLAAT